MVEDYVEFELVLVTDEEFLGSNKRNSAGPGS